MRYRRATSLVELLVLMSACSVILTLSAALLHRAMHIQARSRSYVDAERSATRLSQQFRQDVHRALAHSTGMDFGKGVFLQLTHADGEVVQYGVNSRTVSRSLAQKGAIVAREEYAFSSAVKVKVYLEDRPSRLVLNIATHIAESPNRLNRKSMDLDFSPVSLHAEAVLGRDLRYERVSTREDRQ